MTYPPPFTRPTGPVWRDRILATTPFVLLISALEERHRIRIVALGLHGYVSPGTYENLEGQVPTWNYAAAHLEGPVRWVDEPDETFALVAAQVRQFEGELGWMLADTPLFRAELRAIRAFHITPDLSDTAVKLSQHKAPEDAAAVAAEFRRQGQSALADLMGCTG